MAFVHTHDVMTNYDALYNEFDIVCKDTRLSLDWKHINKTDCQLTEEHPQVCNTLAQSGFFSGITQLFLQSQRLPLIRWYLLQLFRD